MNRQICALSAILMAPAVFAAVPMHVAKDKVYDCVETATEIKADGRPGKSRRTGMVKIVDSGPSFYTLNGVADAAAYSGVLHDEESSGYITNQVDDVTMGRGTGSSEGTYIYISADGLISWDCRK